MREMGFEGELLVSTGSPPETHKHWGISPPRVSKPGRSVSAWCVVVQCSAMCSCVQELACAWDRILVSHFTCERRKQATARREPWRKG
jgi:hypothetical protein